MFRYENFDYGLLKLVNAFKNDGYEVKQVIRKAGRVALLAEHFWATNYDTQEKKRAYYLEGTPYEMGYQLGLLAEKEIGRMTEEFSHKIILSFIGSKILSKIKLLGDLLLSIVTMLSRKTYDNLPKALRDEIQGLYDGCVSVNVHTKVTIERLIALNIGIDTICSMVYSGKFLNRDLQDLVPEDFNIPILCNAFSVCGHSAGMNHFFGRDFMFPSADVFQDTAAVFIYHPVDPEGRPAYPFTSITAPGLIGCIAGMNSNGVGIGVDMSPACNSDPKQVGTNSLLMARMCIQYSKSAEQAVDIIRKLPRGVSWNYIIADGQRDRACVVEAGKTSDKPDFLSSLPEDLKKILPNEAFIQKNMSTKYHNGLMVRWNDYQYPTAYLDFNAGLWKYFNQKVFSNKKMRQEAFLESGYINETTEEQNCPLTYYFPPQREHRRDVVIVTNHFIIPEMRLFAMKPWTARVIGDKCNDIQWRYDELNAQISKTLRQKGSMNYQDAKRIIDFLAPYGKHPAYYENNPRSRDGKQLRIEGCTSVFDLKRRVGESHYGYYCDAWVQVTLGNYI